MKMSSAKCRSFIVFPDIVFMAPTHLLIMNHDIASMSVMAGINLGRHQSYMLRIAWRDIAPYVMRLCTYN